MKRINKELSEKIVKDLQGGILKELLDLLLNDDTLELEFRENYISIYYRGGCISKLEYKSENCYQDYWDENYKNNKSEISEEEEDKNQKLQLKIETSENCKELFKEIIKRKYYMNKAFANKPKREREYQQVVERENNDNPTSNYYIADIEYAKDDCRFDMLAVQRKDGKDYKKLKLAIVEMKYGDKALDNDSGVYEHFDGVKDLSTETILDIIEDAEAIMRYKKDLNLIATNKDYIERGIEIINKKEIDLIFFISAITQKHTKILKELNKIKEYIDENEEFNNREIKINVKVFCPYMAGNMMFDKDIISLDNFLALSEFRKNMQ